MNAGGELKIVEILLKFSANIQNVFSPSSIPSSKVSCRTVVVQFNITSNTALTLKKHIRIYI